MPAEAGYFFGCFGVLPHVLWHTQCEISAKAVPLYKICVFFVCVHRPPVLKRLKVPMK